MGATHKFCMGWESHVFAFTQYLNSSAQLLMVKGGFSLPIYYIYSIPLFSPPVQPLALRARN